MQKIIEKKSLVLIENLICIGCVKYSLLRTEDLSSAVNVLIKILKILHITKNNFFKLSCLHSDINRYDKLATAQISTVFGPVSHVAFPRVL